MTIPSSVPSWFSIDSRGACPSNLKLLGLYGSALTTYELAEYRLLYARCTSVTLNGMTSSVKTELAVSRLVSLGTHEPFLNLRRGEGGQRWLLTHHLLLHGSDDWG